MTEVSFNVSLTALSCHSPLLDHLRQMGVYFESYLPPILKSYFEPLCGDFDLTPSDPVAALTFVVLPTEVHPFHDTLAPALRRNTSIQGG